MPPSLLGLLETRSESLADRRSYTFLSGSAEAESLTFFELNRRARSIAARLQSLGLRGERALLLYPPGIEYIAAFYGCISAGTVAVPAYPPRMNRNYERLDAIVDDARPKVILTTDSVYRQMQRQKEQSPRLAEIAWLVTEEVPVEVADKWVDPRADENTLAFLQYTSASTSKPKGVMVTHGNILHNAALQKEAVRHNDETIIVSWLPLFHDMGLISVVLASLYNGVPCFLMSPVDFLKRPLSWLEAISRYRATFSGAPDFGFQLCVDRITEEERASLDLTSWRVAFNGSEPVRASTLDSFAKTFASCGFKSESIYPCYGLAENTLFASGGFYRGAKAFSRTSLEAHRPLPLCATQRDCPVERLQTSYLVNCGTPLPDSHVRIVDPVSLIERKPGEVGEIWLSSPSVARGYWNLPELTETTFKAHLSSGEGPFLRTGDLGFFDDGQFYISGRLKDLIIIRGRNLVPQDIEQIVEQCDAAIRPAYVASISIEAGGYERLAIVAEVRRENRREMEAEALVGKIRNAVRAEFAVNVSAVTLLRPNSLPKTSSGKTQRAKVREDLLHGLSGILYEWRDEKVFRDVEQKQRALADFTIEQIEKWLKEKIGVRAKVPAHLVDVNSAVTSYGLDSVEAVGFGCEVEESFGICFHVDTFFVGDPTLRHVAQRIFADRAACPMRTHELVVVEGNGHLQGKEHKQAVVATISATHPEKRSHIDPVVRHGGPNTSSVVRTTLGNGIHPIPVVRERDYRAYVNPELGRALAQMAMDKTFVRGEGSWLWDENGRKYLDFLAQYGALPFGFNPPRVWQALQTVYETGEPSFVQPSYLNAAGELAKRLIAALPKGMAYVTFSNSGAEAVEAAIKLCRSTTGRKGILAATGGFHGKTLGALSATAKPKYQTPFGAPVEGFDYVAFGDTEALRAALASRSYAGFLVEPIQAEGGIVEAPTGYLRQARKICRETGTLFVVDEIQTGLGRTGAMFASSQLGITPDIMVLAKALGGGLVPIGACISTAESYNADFALKHTSTFAGNTLACRAGIAALDLLEENDGALVRQVAANGLRLKQALLDLQLKYAGVIREIRGRGYLLGVCFGLNRHSVEEGLLGYLGEQEALTALVVSHLLDVESMRVGYTLNQGGVLRIEPALTATWEECTFFLEAFERVLKRLERADVAALTAQVSGFQIPVEAPVRKRSPIPKRTGPRIESCASDGRFAFLVHPLAWKDYGDLDGKLAVLSEDQLKRLSTAFADNFDPMVIGETRITGANGKSAYGEFILLPRRAEELKAMPQADALDEIRLAVKLGQERGARIVGLGAYTSVVCQGGYLLKGDGMPALTTGNSFTAAAARQAVRLAAAERGWNLSDCTVAIIGAGGSVGQALSILLSTEARSLILLGNPAHPDASQQRLKQVVGRIAHATSEMPWRAQSGSVAEGIAELALDAVFKSQENGIVRLAEELIQSGRYLRTSVDAARMMREADIVVSCTNTTERMIRPECLRPSAVVCDVARPSNVCEQMASRRRDIMVIDGAVVRLPGSSSLGFNTSLAHGHAYACMAETMILAMEHRYTDLSLGFDLPLGPVLELESLAEKHGFEVVAHRGAQSTAVEPEEDLRTRAQVASV